MCGFTGFWSLGGKHDQANLIRNARRMGERIAHRGPDDAHEWADPGIGFAISFRRLSILDLTLAGRQPMASRSGRHIVCFNGEIYNFVVLRRELEGQGALFSGHSDTEVLVELIDRLGVVKALRRLRGMFAVACFDRHEQTLHLARDPRGKKPLYFGEINGSLLFGSQPKAFFAHPSFQPEINRNALLSFFRFGYIPAPQSIFQGISKLRAGERAEFHKGRLISTERYYDPAGHAVMLPEIKLSDEAATDRLELLIGEAVERRLAADVPLGAFLSGGIDSSLIVAMMKERAFGGVNSFAIGFSEEDYNEASHAEAVAKHLGVNHQTLNVTPADVMNTIPLMPSVYDEPFADPSQVPTLLLCQLTRGHVTVALSGDGGDELFSGYTRYGLLEDIAASIRLVPDGVKPVIRALLLSLPGAVWRFAEPFVPERFGRSPLESRVRRVADMLGRDAIEKLYRDLAGQWCEPGAIVIGGSEELDPAWTGRDDLSGCDANRKARLIDMLFYLPEDILVKVDRASMAVGLEVRAPLLDQDIVDFAFALPREQLVRGGNAKWLLRQVLYRHVPPEIIDRPKMGFGFPVAEWLRGPLRDWAEDLLDPERMRQTGILNPAPISHRWQAHISGEADWSYRLWCVLMFEAWRRTLPDLAMPSSPQP